MKKSVCSRIFRCVNPRQRTEGQLVLGGLLFVAALMLVMLPFEASAATFTVNSTADMPDFHPGDGICNAKPLSKSVRPVCTLRAAIMEANALGGANTIVLKPGIYTIAIPGQDEDAGATGDLDISSDLTITGSGASTTIIDGGGLDRVFDIHSGNVEITGVTIRNGNSGTTGGGGILNNNYCTMTLKNSTVSDSTAGAGGGGILNANFGIMTLTDVTVRNNGAQFDGGGIYHGSFGTMALTSVTVSGNTTHGNGGGINIGSAISMSDSIVSDNTADGAGGGIYSTFGTMDLTNVTISNNSSGTTSYPGGGGIANLAATMSLTNVTVSDNSARADGGGIYNYIGSMMLTNSTVRNNSAQFGGGAFNSRVLTLMNSTVNHNTAGGGGGGINSFGELTLINSTVSGNSAGTVGGGLFNGSGQFASLVNVTSSGNTAPVGSELFNDVSGVFTLKNTIVAGAAGDNCAGTITSRGNNLEDADTCGFAGPGDIINTDPLLGPLANNGGPTLTHALLPGSPAIDAGSNSLAPSTDQRGVARPQDGNGDGIAVCDIGAFELAVGTFSISGNVATPEGLPVEGVTITLGGSGTGTTTTDFNGNFTFTGLTNGTYTIAPSKAGYAVVPTPVTVYVSGTDVSNLIFVAMPTAASTFSISGKVTVGTLPLPGVTIILSGADNRITTVTNLNGNYTFTKLATGTYTITPQSTRYTFIPTSRTVTSSGANITGQNFVVK